MSLRQERARHPRKVVMAYTRTLATLASAVLLAVSVSACDEAGTSEPNGNEGETTPTAPPTDDPNTSEEN